MKRIVSLYMNITSMQDYLFYRNYANKIKALIVSFITVDRIRSVWSRGTRITWWGAVSIPAGEGGLFRAAYRVGSDSTSWGIWVATDCSRNSCLEIKKGGIHRSDHTLFLYWLEYRPPLFAEKWTRSSKSVGRTFLDGCFTMRLT